MLRDEGQGRLEGRSLVDVKHYDGPAEREREGVERIRAEEEIKGRGDRGGCKRKTKKSYFFSSSPINSSRSKYIPSYTMINDAFCIFLFTPKHILLRSQLNAKFLDFLFQKMAYFRCFVR